MNKSPSRGRRAGSPDTRAAVLEVARRRFLADGYQAVTMRSVAAEAGVDAALISYFFGSKRGLFGAVMALVANPAEVLAEAMPGELNTLPERILHALLTAWDDPERSAPMRTMIAGAAADLGLARLLGEVLQGEMIGRIAGRIGGPDASARACVASIQPIGLIFQRYILRVEPLASMPVDELVTRMAPAMRAALGSHVRPSAGRRRTHASPARP